MFLVLIYIYIYIYILISSLRLLPLPLAGLTMGIVGMCEGEVRRITIPPELAFDDKSIFMTGPPNGTYRMIIPLFYLYTYIYIYIHIYVRL